MLSLFRESLPATLNKQDEKLFRKYSLNFLIRSYAHMSTGFLDFLRYLKIWRQNNRIRYSDFRYIDMHGIISIVSIVLNNKKVIGFVRWLRN